MNLKQLFATKTYRVIGYSAIHNREFKRIVNGRDIWHKFACRAVVISDQFGKRHVKIDLISYQISPDLSLTECDRLKSDILTSEVYNIILSNVSTRKANTLHEKIDLIEYEDAKWEWQEFKRDFAYGKDTLTYPKK